MGLKSMKEKSLSVIEAARRNVRREINYYRTTSTYALLFITYRCTSRCKMCAVWQQEVDPNKEMTLDEWKRITDSLHDLGVRHIEFFGGDSLLRKDILLPLIAHAHSKGIYTEMPTNCNLLDRDTAIGLVKAGLDDIWISLDGVEDTHDRTRGREGTFSSVDSALRSLRDARTKDGRPRIYVNCVITRHNVQNFEKVISYAREMGVDGVDFECVGQMPEASISNTELDGIKPTPFFVSTDESPVLLSMEDATLLKKKLESIKRSQAHEQPWIGTSKIDILSKKDIVLGRFPNRRCYICRDWLTVDPYGNVLGCLQFNNYILGDARTNHLSTIWRGDRHRKFIKARDRGRFDICNYCSNGAIRNNTPMQVIQREYYRLIKRGKS
jgi:radical SAM protein with 4Fe4S-binding SPASM domain